MVENATEFTPTNSRKKERISSSENREIKLEEAKKTGFDDEQKKWIVEKLTAIALPVDNIKSLHKKKNKFGSENLLGTWGYGTSNYGEFSIYELLDRQINEKKIGTLTHESAHANTPFEKNNTFIFGSETALENAAEHAREVADQTLVTKRFLGGYHKYLYTEFMDEKIDLETFEEETWAIMTELAFTNRAHLEQVQEAQHKSLDKLKRKGKDTTEKVYLISHPGLRGETVIDGVDTALINLVDGVDTLDALKEHVISLKGEVYSESNFDVAKQRLEEERKKKKKKEKKDALLAKQQLPEEKPLNNK